MTRQFADWSEHVDTSAARLAADYPVEDPHGTKLMERYFRKDLQQHLAEKVPYHVAMAVIRTREDRARTA